MTVFGLRGIVGSAHPVQPWLVQNSRIHDGNRALDVSGNVVVEGNEIFDIGGGCSATVTGGTFRQNFVHDNSGQGAVCASSGAVVEFNTIVDNGATGIVLTEGGGEQIRNNTVAGHGVNLLINGDHGATVADNNFIGPLGFSGSLCGGNRQYHLAVLNFSCEPTLGSGPAFPPGGVILDATSNWWNTTDATGIAGSIRDSVDDLTILGTVDPQPTLAGPEANAGAVAFPVVGVVRAERAVGLTAGGEAVAVFGHNFQLGTTLRTVGCWREVSCGRAARC